MHLTFFVRSLYPMIEYKLRVHQQAVPAEHQHPVFFLTSSGFSCWLVLLKVEDEDAEDASSRLILRDLPLPKSLRNGAGFPVTVPKHPPTPSFPASPPAAPHSARTHRERVQLKMSSEASSQSVLDRVQSFVSEHKQAIIIGASVAIAVGGVAYYASTSSSRGPSGDPEGGSGKSRSKKKSKKRKSVKDPDGPILEEIEPKHKPQSEESCESLPYTLVFV